MCRTILRGAAEDRLRKLFDRMLHQKAQNFRACADFKPKFASYKPVNDWIGLLELELEKWNARKRITKSLTLRDGHERTQKTQNFKVD
jgi:hypothetical protein